MCCFSCVQLFANPWTAAHQAPLFMEFSKQEYWCGLPFPSLRDLPKTEIKLVSLMLPKDTYKIKENKIFFPISMFVFWKI